MALGSGKSANSFLPLYGGDYLRDTMHLSCAEHGVYLRLLIHYWHAQAPLPDDERKLAGIAGARDPLELKALDSVLREFFPMNGALRHNKRMDLEIEKWRVIQDAKRRAGLASAASRLGDAGRAGTVLDKSSTRVQRVFNPPPPVKDKSKTQVAALPLPEWLDQKTWGEWVRICRPAKARQPESLSAALKQLTAWKGEGHDPNAIVARSLASGWRGLFLPDYLRPGATPERAPGKCAHCGEALDKGWTQSPKGRVCDPCWKGYRNGGW